MAAYSSLPLLFGLVAPLTFWACETCDIISHVDGPEQAQHGSVQWAATPGAMQGGGGSASADAAVPVVPVTPKLSVAAQPTINDLAQFAAAGYGTLISNRPAGETPDQPSPEALAAEAQRLGMEFVYIPVTPESISRDDVASFRAALATADGPVIAHCRSGKRAYLLWAAGEVLEADRDPAELMAIAGQQGFPLDELPAIVERLRR